ncbi:MAG: hypothetical protein LBC45_01250 [Chlamydiales bacterium]|jgi:hypothetical protein|nr:hypothetical protein [Chlamydiales bacterium]
MIKRQRHITNETDGIGPIADQAHKVRIICKISRLLHKNVERMMISVSAILPDVTDNNP